MRSSRGFTLLELLVSMSIFAVLGLGAYQMLQTVSDSHERVKLTADSLIKLNLAFSIIQRDFNQYAPRPVRDEYGEPLPAIMFENDDYVIELTRRGWSNPAGRNRSHLQRVAYSIDFDEETLTRHFWEVLDRAEDSEPISQILLDGVTDFQVTGFTGEESDVETDFSLDEVGDVAPLAVEVVITTNTLGDTRRLFQMTEPYTAVLTRQVDDGGDPDREDGGSPDPQDPDGEPDGR